MENSMETFGEFVLQIAVVGATILFILNCNK